MSFGENFEIFFVSFLSQTLSRTIVLFLRVHFSVKDSVFCKIISGAEEAKIPRLGTVLVICSPTEYGLGKNHAGEKLLQTSRKHRQQRSDPRTQILSVSRSDQRYVNNGKT